MKNAKKDYKLTTSKLLDGAPPVLESVPLCEFFNWTYSLELGKVRMESDAARDNYLKTHNNQKQFKSIDDIESVFDGDVYKKPESVNR